MCKIRVYGALRAPYTRILHLFLEQAPEHNNPEGACQAGAAGVVG